MTDLSKFDVLVSREGIAIGDLVEVFSDPVARYAVVYLLEEETATLGELADVVTGWANADSGEVASRTDRDRVEVELYHLYLPKLAAMDVLEFDPDEKRAAIEASPETLAPLLEWVRTTGADDHRNGQG